MTSARNSNLKSEAALYFPFFIIPKLLFSSEYPSKSKKKNAVLVIAIEKGTPTCYGSSNMEC